MPEERDPAGAGQPEARGTVRGPCPKCEETIPADTPTCPGCGYVRQFRQEQYDLLMRCSEAEDFSEWNEWRDVHENEPPLLEAARLPRAHLKGADLSSAHLEGADLLGAHLEGAHLAYAHLDGAGLSSARLEGAYLYDAHLKGANLHGAHLGGADLWFAHLKGARLIDAHLEGADLCHPDLENADLVGAVITRFAIMFQGTSVPWHDLNVGEQKPQARKKRLAARLWSVLEEKARLVYGRIATRGRP